MATNWASPQTIQQYSEAGAEDVHISWLEENNFSSLKFKDGKSIRTTKNLLHIARDPRNNIKNKTYFLRCTNFNFENLPLELKGIEVKITMNRFGRVTDETIQLCLNDELIGNNQASLTLDPIKIFGNETNIWDTNLTIANVQDPTFGVVVRFQSHPNWPHSSSILIDAIEIRVH